jgi:hypothetical protein
MDTVNPKSDCPNVKNLLPVLSNGVIREGFKASKTKVGYAGKGDPDPHKKREVEEEEREKM